MANLTTTEIKRLVAVIRDQLERRADPVYREKIAKLVPTEIEIIGVRVTVIRTLVKEFRARRQIFRALP